MDSLTADQVFPVYLHEPSTGSIYEVISKSQFRQYQNFKQGNNVIIAFHTINSGTEQVENMLFDKVGKIDVITKNKFDYMYHEFLVTTRRQIMRKYIAKKKLKAA